MGMSKQGLAFLKKLTATMGPSGYEEETARAFREEAAKFADEARTDVHGNTIVRVKGKRGGGPVDIHANRRAHRLGAPQRAVLIRQARVVHLHELPFLRLLAFADSLENALLPLRPAQGQVLLSGEDRAHHLRPVLVIDNVYTHSITTLFPFDVF